MIHVGKKAFWFDSVACYQYYMPMDYSFYKTVDIPFEEAIERVTEELKKEGFGVLTEIDVQATLKQKLDVDFGKYRILGACNPPFAYRSLNLEPRIGLMLPCNVIVRENDEGKAEVAVVDPVASMAAIDNRDLGELADEVRAKLKNVVAAL